MERDVKFNSGSKSSSGQRGGKGKNNAGRHKGIDKINGGKDKLPPVGYDYFGLYNSSSTGKKSHNEKDNTYFSDKLSSKPLQKSPQNAFDTRERKNSRGKSGADNVARGSLSSAGRKEIYGKSVQKRQGKNERTSTGKSGVGNRQNASDRNLKNDKNSIDANRGIVMNRGKDKQGQQRSNKRKNRRRHGSPILLYIMLIIIVLGISAVLCCTVFFGAETIEVSGTSRYSTEQIIAASSLNEGDNIFVANTSKAEGEITNQLPYIGSAKISRTLFPPKFVITVEETQAKYVTEDGMVVLDGRFKILENSAAPDFDKSGLTLLKGVSFTSPVAGQTAAFENEDISDTLKQIAKGLEKQKISDITKIDLSDTMDIRITYQNRILMFIGSTAELDYKMSYAKTMLTNQLSSSQEGKLDLSWLVSGNSTVYFSQGSIEIFESGKNENTSSESGQSNGSLASNSETPSSEVSDSSNSSNYSSSSNASSSSIGAE